MKTHYDLCAYCQEAEDLCCGQEHEAGYHCLLSSCVQASPCAHTGEWQWLPHDESGQWYCITCGAPQGRNL